MDILLNVLAINLMYIDILTCNKRTVRMHVNLIINVVEWNKRIVHPDIGINNDLKNTALKKPKQYCNITS